MSPRLGPIKLSDMNQKKVLVQSLMKFLCLLKQKSRRFCPDAICITQSKIGRSSIVVCGRREL